MGIRTGPQYFEALKSRKPNVWMNRRKIESVFRKPVFCQPAKEIARLYDMQHDPQLQDKITHICEETGERVNNSFIIPRNYEDLRSRSVVFEVWGKLPSRNANLSRIYYRGT